MKIDLKLDKAGDALTVSVTGDIDMSSSTKIQDALPPLFQNNNKDDDLYVDRSVLDIYKTLSNQEIEQFKTLEGQSSFANKP